MGERIVQCGRSEEVPPVPRTALGGAFWRFWSAAALTNLGDGIRVAAFPLLAASLTSDPLPVAVVAAAQALPWVVTGLAAGALADRRSTRALVVGADIARILVLAALVAAVATGAATVGLVVGCAFLVGVGETVRDTAAQTAVPRLVPEPLLEKANGRLVAAEVVGNEFVGPPLGAALFVAGAALPFAVNGASMALAVMLVLSLPLSLGRLAARDHELTITPGVRFALTWLARHRVLRTLALVFAAVAAADSAWFAIFVLYVEDVLDLPAVGYGALLATGAVGGLAGAALADRLVRGTRHRRVVGWSMAVTAGAPVLLLVAADTWAAVVVVVATSGAFGVLNVAALSLRQRLVPQGLLGRVIGASRTLVYGAAALGAVLGGWLAARYGLHAPFVFSGAVAVVATTAWWLTPPPPSAASS